MPACVRAQALVPLGPSFLEYPYTEAVSEYSLECFLT